MEKVVLITSRMFDEYKVSQKRLFGINYAKLFIEYKDGRKISSHLRNTNDFKYWFSDETGSVLMKKVQQCCEDNTLDKINKQINRITELQMFDNSTIKDDYISFFDEMAKNIVNPKKAEGKEFHAGLYIVDTSTDERLYLAEEYPYPDVNEDFSQEKQNYLDALLEIINQQNPDISDLVIISHDRDWGKSSECVISLRELELYVRMENLKTLLDKNTKVEVFCFQHDEERSQVYKGIKANIASASSLLNESMSWDKGTEDFKSFFNGSSHRENIDLTNSLLPSVVIPDSFYFEEIEEA